MVFTDPKRMAAVLIYARGERAQTYVNERHIQAVQSGSFGAVRFWDLVRDAVSEILHADIQPSSGVLH